MQDKRIILQIIIDHWFLSSNKPSNCNTAQFLNCNYMEKEMQPTPVFLPGKVHGQRSLAGCSPWGYMTEHVCTRVEGDGLLAIKW